MPGIDGRYQKLFLAALGAFSRTFDGMYFVAAKEYWCILLVVLVVVYVNRCYKVPHVKFQIQNPRE